MSAFYGCTSLKNISFPNCEYIASEAFKGCASLVSISFPACKSIGGTGMFYYGAFENCVNLVGVDFSAASIIGNFTFKSCTSLENIRFPKVTSIGSSAFYGCTSLSSLTLTNSSVVTLKNRNAFAYTPMSLSTYTGSYGSIYVPTNLVDSYKTATNWVTYSDRITGVE
jgi:hypothetical protein